MRTSVNNSFIFNDCDIDNLLFRSSWLSEIDGERTFIQEVIQACRKIIWKYSDLWFSHIAYPFKARMRPQVARSLINITCPNSEGVVLDPFCGSGTTCTEAYLCGLNSVGIDIVPFYAYMSEAKIKFFEQEIIFNPIANENNSHPLLDVIHAACTLLRTKFKYEKRASEIIELQRIYFEQIRDKLYSHGKTEHKFLVGTATDIPFPSGHFNAVVCSPPYGSAIKYEEENPGPEKMMGSGLSGYTWIYIHVCPLSSPWASSYHTAPSRVHRQPSTPPPSGRTRPRHPIPAVSSAASSTGGKSPHA